MRDALRPLEVAVDLLEQVRDHLRLGDVLHALHDPAALAADASLPDVEHLHRDLQLVRVQGEDVRLRVLRQHHGVALEHAAQRGDVVPQPGRVLVAQLLDGTGHGLLQLADEPVRVPGHEVAEVLGQRAMVRRADPAHAGRRALADVAEQARPVLGAGPLEHARRARADREDAQHQVHGLADRLGRVERAEVLHAGLPVAAHHLDARELLVHGHGQVRVRLVVPVHDVEPGAVLLDPRVLELERLQLGADDGPLDRGRREHHGPGLGGQPSRVLEIGAQAGAQVLRLADVDDASVRVAEAVDAGRRGDLARSRAVGGRISHGHPGWRCTRPRAPAPRARRWRP